ncbi:MAG: methylenetetrahydrofolate reductase [NAD(P)H] [Pseudomonadota bacterium]|nr:methylenetetrahydrofolate reductase [NAD(P)H] [Pseudomonadota bacterium]MEC9459224.1 methylenetetrahydrofolate reductase [NAD(P)H] [Pseudomonadota bacterium]MEC9481638.1 methylenetetrahydrofolate reductase [NAD(P)H] [Pseudomonadota bacterium]MED5437020.1 methylenetetrahydrofolate reductase [NAD(P)H] [Pseudomonadota bacterium]
MDISFEFFPPNSSEAEKKLWSSIKLLEPLNPKFVSVTYGAGGSTRERTHDCVSKILKETSLIPAAHLTCVSATKDQTEEIIEDYKYAGVKHIVALRGDMPDMKKFKPHPEGYKSSIDLITRLKKDNFDITVSAYPEKHPDAESLDSDIDFLKRKIDAGASSAITQFCFEIDYLLNFRDKLKKANINIPIIPGIIPTTNFTGIKKMANKCGASIPIWLENAYEGLENNLEERKKISEEIAIDFSMNIKKNGFESIHFYTLNQSELALSVCKKLNIGYL